MHRKRWFWNHIYKHLGKYSIRTQLFAVYVITMVIPMLVIGTFLITNTYKLLSDSNDDLIQADNSRVKNILFEITTQTNNLSESIYYDNRLHDLLKGYYSSGDNFRRAVNKIDFLDNYKSTYVEISDMTIYTDNPAAVDYKQFVKVNREISEMDWYKKGISQSGAFWTSIVRKSSTGVPSYYLCLVRQIPMLDSNYNAVLVMWINDEYLRSNIENSMFQTEMSVGNGPSFYSSNRSLTGSEMPVYIDYSQNYFSSNERLLQDDKVCLTSLSTLNTYKADSRIYVLTINKTGYYEVMHIIMVCLGIIAVSIVVPGVLILAFTHYLTGRIDLLRSEMHKASMADYELIQMTHGQDELSQAHQDLEIMVTKIKEHDAFVYEARLREQEIENRQHEMEYKMLASQINPHFLYNTLETIRMKAFTSGDREVADATKLLGKSMRYVLENTGTNRTTLARELEHIEYYLKIQQIRFQDRSDYTLNIQEGLDTEKIYVLPLLLQPLVENSMVHGLENLEKNGKICVSVFMEEKYINIIISDNGEGMDEEALDNLRKSIDTKDISHKSSIGLYNINQRLKLLYGEDYSFIIDSVINEGTTVTLKLPVNKCLQ